MIGKDATIKVILSSYIAILSSDALGNLIAQSMASEHVTGILTIPYENKAVILVKIATFVLLTVLLTTRGAFDIVIADEKSGFLRMLMTGVYGILSAGLIISTILIYVSGISLFQSASILETNPITEIVEGSQLVALMVQNYSLWFALPAVAFVIASLFGNEE